MISIGEAPMFPSQMVSLHPDDTCILTIVLIVPFILNSFLHIYLCVLLNSIRLRHGCSHSSHAVYILRLAPPPALCYVLEVYSC